MKAHQRIACLTALAIMVGFAGTALTGCASNPVDVRSPGTTDAPTTSARPWYAQAPVAQPTSSHGAILAAVSAVNADQVATTGMLEGKVPFRSIGDFESGEWLKAVTLTSNDFSDDASAPAMSGPASVWLPDPRGSSVSPLHRAGKTYQFGQVTMKGCFRVRNAVFLPASNGKPLPASYYAAGFVPYVMTAEYQPSKRIWLVTKGTYLTSAAETANCSGLGDS